MTVADHRLRIMTNRGLGLTVACAVWLSVMGCSAFKSINATPLENFPHSIPVCDSAPRNGSQPIDLRLLGQASAAEHRIGDRDVLGIYIEGVLGADGSTPPVNFPSERTMTPSLGYPVPVRNGGRIELPMAGSIDVHGLTLSQAEQKLRHTFTVTYPVLKSGRERIHVSLQRPRSVRVLVLRQEAFSGARRINGGQAAPDEDHRTGHVVELPVYHNDVLTALTRTGGMPRSEAENAVYIFRRGHYPGSMPVMPRPVSNPIQATLPRIPQQASTASPAVQHAAYWSGRRGQPLTRNPDAYDAGRHNASSGFGHSQWAFRVSQSGHEVLPNTHHGHVVQAPRAAVGASSSSVRWTSSPSTFSDGLEVHRTNPVQVWSPGACSACLSCDENSHPGALRIPLRLPCGQAPAISPADVILSDGDIVLVEARETDYFFTSGLLGGGQFALPRDYDLNVLDAISIAESTGTQAFINRPTRAIGGVSALNRDVTVGASRAVIERDLPGYGTTRIAVDLYKAMELPQHRVRIQPGDRIYLEYTPKEAFWAFIERHLLEGSVNGTPTIISGN